MGRPIVMSSGFVTLAIVDHTYVDPSLRGSGVGRALVEAIVGWARETGVRILPLCPYARATFSRHPELRDVLR